MQALGLSPNAFGLHMITAAYSPEGAQWVDDLLAYIDENRKIFDAGINAIPGLTSMPLEATYLAWVDVSGHGHAFGRSHRSGAKNGPKLPSTTGLLLAKVARAFCASTSARNAPM